MHQWYVGSTTSLFKKIDLYNYVTSNTVIEDRYTGT